MTAELRDSDEARSRVAFWYGQFPKSDLVRPRLAADLALVEPMRARALALVDSFERNLRWRQAEDLLYDLAYKGMLHDEIMEHLRTAQGLDLAVRREALVLGASLVESPSALDRTSRGVVSQAGAAPAAIRRALKQAETACRLAPDMANFQTTLGMARYRAGDYREAVATLARAAEIGAAYRDAANPATLAFTAMAQYQLGQHDAAHDALKRLRKLANEPPGVSEQAKAFLREAGQLIERNPAGPSRPAGAPPAGAH